MIDGEDRHADHCLQRQGDAINEQASGALLKCHHIEEPSGKIGLPLESFARNLWQSLGNRERIAGKNPLLHRLDEPGLEGMEHRPNREPKQDERGEDEQRLHERTKCDRVDERLDRDRDRQGDDAGADCVENHQADLAPLATDEAKEAFVGGRRVRGVGGVGGVGGVRGRRGRGAHGRQSTSFRGRARPLASTREFAGRGDTGDGGPKETGPG